MPDISKRDLIAMVSEKCAITSAEAARTLELVTGLIFEQLAKGNSVSLRGFGTFQLRKAKSKLGRNPSNPQQVKVIPERWVVRFRPAGAMKEALSVLPFEDPATP
ncbi:MAG: HU family DNA-binding protein [Verrucomicrobiales bacterium]|nr:HU family DNA-binding protein [Verrucomicrobiales bacterium]MCP5557766.1 HU family DNA-binding protein [Verrucomicrobiaceae bacterium]